jgi:acyl-CoA-binding protein
VSCHPSSPIIDNRGKTITITSDSSLCNLSSEKKEEMTEIESSTTTRSMSTTTTLTAETDKQPSSSPTIPTTVTGKMVNGSNDTSNGDHLEASSSKASSNKLTPVNANNTDDNNGNIFNLGFDLDKLFTLGFSFYRKYESKAFHPSYEERNHLVALSLQAKYGPFKEEKAPSFGALDIVGRDRRQAWADLGNLSNQDAKKEFLFNLNRLCPLFRPFVEAHAREEEDRRRQEEAIRRKEEEERQRRQQEMDRLNAQK